MVTQNGDARYHPPDSRVNVKRPENNRGAIPHPLAITASSTTPRTAGPPSPYRAYRPGRPPACQPTIPKASPTQPNFPYVPQMYRSPTFPNSTEPDNQSSWHSRTEMERTQTQQSRNPRIGLKPSASTIDMRTRQHSQFRLDKLSSSSSPAMPRFPHHYHSPELHIDCEVRSSSQSALTSSSIDPTSSTERSSIVTKNSSVTDLSPDELDMDGGMSVDDAISMYLDGFTDDLPLPPVPTPKLESSIIEAPELEMQGEGYQGSVAIQADNGQGYIESRDDEKLRSEELQEAINSDMPEIAIPVAVEGKSKDSTYRYKRKKLVIPPALPGVVPPPRSHANALRDQYGFQRTSSHISTSDYEAWNRSYVAYQETRKQKWEELLKEVDLPSVDPVTFPPRSPKVKRYVRKGIPPDYRGAAWFHYAGGYGRYHKNPGRYNQLVKAALNGPSDDDKEHIERDLHRTFPDNIHFKPDSIPGAESDLSPESGSSNPKYLSKAPEAEIIQSLRRVLYAFAAHNPKVGYTQSLNFIAGMLLLFLPEEKAFWMLDIITSTYLPGTHEISLEGANIDLWILMVTLKDSLPAIYTKVASTTPTTGKIKPPPINTKTRLPDITLGLTNWLMSMFIGSLPLETTLRVWDIFFYEGSRTFFRVALAIFKSSEKEILAVNDPMEIFQIVQSAPKKLLDASSVADDCFARRFRLSQARVEELRAARRKAIREDKGRLSLLLSGKGNLQAGSNEPPSSARTSSPRSTAWKSLKKHTFR
ncbi:uncharacterized protein PADG_00811 [Paracoccidioides brasiliensis Pb18]|uniref:Rab-GAP TBC domain-containing protein n=1 Tax=Paracoccidioides brasiliensis (strain Pb18) TaxID=502780 RepID=C1FYD5_PARBD|nr:uncharacterized protein PADG_00811 [Paracoccidioides brasiliensis Pb18]EEH44522.1 hypothetical protein PADG_00811 [Paracoccidioides brasiliensis Pb18]